MAPADSTTDNYEKFLQTLINRVQANPELWASTVIFITTDEGGGFYTPATSNRSTSSATAPAFRSLRSRPSSRRAMSIIPITTTFRC